MPVYVYHCEHCGIEFEKYQHFSEKPLIRCPECRMETLHKVYTPVGIIFKGSGFYSTDNRSASSMSIAANAKKEKKSETSTDSKSDATKTTDKTVKSDKEK